VLTSILKSGCDAHIQINKVAKNINKYSINDYSDAILYKRSKAVLALEIL